LASSIRPLQGFAATLALESKESRELDFLLDPTGICILRQPDVFGVSEVDGA